MRDDDGARCMRERAFFPSLALGSPPVVCFLPTFTGGARRGPSVAAIFIVYFKAPCCGVATETANQKPRCDHFGWDCQHLLTPVIGQVISPLRLSAKAICHERFDTWLSTV